MLIFQLSERLALFAPELTLDFLSQACLELEKSNVPQKAICLRYITPWIRNLNKFCDPTSDLYELSGARMRDCVRLLLDMTVRDPEVNYSAFGTAYSTETNTTSDVLHDHTPHLAGSW